MASARSDASRPLLLRAGQWRVRPGLLSAPPSMTPGELREACAAQGVAAGEDTPDDLLLAAAASGASSSPALLDILDGGEFVAAPCLCCYHIRDPEQFREVQAALRLFGEYFDPAQHVRSRAFGRTVATLSRDLFPDEVEMVRRRLAAQVARGAAQRGAAPTPPDALREIHHLERGLCLAEPPCRPGTLWVYSTPDGRRLLRYLSRLAQREMRSHSLRVTVASSDPGCLPRYRFRMYSAALEPRGGGRGQDVSAPSPSLLARATLDWARTRSRQRRQRAPPAPPPCPAK